MMRNLRPQEGNITKDIRNLFGVKKELNSLQLKI